MTMSERESILKGLYDSVISGNAEQASDFARQSIQAGLAPLESLDKGLTLAIREVGDRFSRGEAYLPEMVLSADAMQAAVTVLSPHLDARDTKKKGKVLIGSVQGDIHDIGKNIVAALMAVNGYDVIDVGRDVPPATFVDAAATHKVDIIAMSSLLTTTMAKMVETIELLSEDGVRARYKVIVGGSPISQSYADKIGADGYGNTASDAVALCDRLLGLSA